MSYTRGHAPEMVPARLGLEPAPHRQDASPERPMVPTVVRWPIDVDPGFERYHPQDPWEAVVRDSIVAYREGRTDVARWAWATDIVWQVAANGSFSEEHHGGERIFAYHTRLVRLAEGRFRQILVALEASGGPLIEAHVRTVAQHADRRLDMPSLIVFELAGSRIRRVTEMPGNHAEWERFWAD